MWLAQVNGIWYKVLDVIDMGEGNQNSYNLEGLGLIPHSEIQQLEIRSSSKQVKSLNKSRSRLLQARTTLAKVNNSILFKYAQDDTQKISNQDVKKYSFDIEKAKRAAPSYWSALDLEDHKAQILKVLNTSANPNTPEFYEAVYSYQLSNPSITMKDGILGPETFKAMGKTDQSLLKAVQVTQNKNFDDFLEKNKDVAEKSGNSFDLTRFKQRIGKIESGGKYDIINELPGSTATGKYQFIWSIWKKPISNFAGRDVTREQFLKSPQLQELFMDFYTKSELLPAAQRLKQKYPAAEKLTLEQLAGLVHFKGAFDAAKILSGQPDPTTRGNVSVQQYLSKLV